MNFVGYGIVGCLAVSGCNVISQQEKALPESAVLVPEYISSPEIDKPEFSGCMPALEDGKFWIVSDDNKENIFLINGRDGFERSLSWDDKKLNDMEGIASDGGGGFFVITSQSLNSDGESKKSRNRLTHIRDFSWDSGDRRTVKQFRKVLLRDFPWLNSVKDLGPKVGGIDIEGLAYDRKLDRMWFGFRGPLVDASNPSMPGDNAVLVQLDRALLDWDPEDRNQPLEYTWSQNSPHFLDLDGKGIRDLYHDGNERLLILAGEMGAGQSGHEGTGALWLYEPVKKELSFLFDIPQVPHQRGDRSKWSSAEGICTVRMMGEKKLVVVYDSEESGIFSIVSFER